jgi:hypothetical protein
MKRLPIYTIPYDVTSQKTVAYVLKLVVGVMIIIIIIVIITYKLSNLVEWLYLMNRYFNLLLPNVTSEFLTILFCIRKVPGLNLGAEIGYSDWSFCSPSSLSRQTPARTRNRLNHSTNSFFACFSMYLSTLNQLHWLNCAKLVPNEILRNETGNNVQRAGLSQYMPWVTEKNMEA